MTRIALGIEYDGTRYVGWQRQKSGTGVQQCVEEAIAAVADETVEATCAGRTDAGVHATGQVAHFDTGRERTMRGWLLGINSNLPADINATFATAVADDFHARFSALSRTYHYLVLNRLARSSLYRHRAWWVHETLDDAAMNEAARHLLGEHDFSAYRAAGCQASTPVREVMDISVARQGCWIRVTVTANAFLQHMVRNIVGTLIEIGRGEIAPDAIPEILASRERKRAGPTAPARGLCLVEVFYDGPRPKRDADSKKP